MIGLPDAAALATFAATCLLIELTPGPNMAWLAMLAATEGRRPGFAAVAGVAIGLSLVGTAATFGLTALLAAEPSLYNALKFAGVAYLLWIAFDTWRGVPEADTGGPLNETALRHLRRGIITNVLNPKAAVFFVTVLPGFLAPGAGFAANMVLSAIYVGIATLVHAAIVAVAGTAQGWLSEPARQTTVRRVMALGLVAVAVWLYQRT